MEPEKGQLEKETHLQTTILGGSMLVFRGVVLPKTGAKTRVKIQSRGDWVTFAPKMSLPGCAMIFP